MYSPQVTDYQPRGWKRLVTERPNDVVQLAPMQRKRSERDEVNETEIGVMGKKLCSKNTTQKQTAEAVGQLR